MKIIISYDSELPLYEQIEYWIKDAIYNNKLKNNELLPSVRQLSADLNVSAITVKRAYSDLEHEGLIYTLTGRGTFVRIDNIEEVIMEQKEKVINEANQVISKCKKFGLTVEDIKEIVNRIYVKDGK